MIRLLFLRNARRRLLIKLRTGPSVNSPADGVTGRVVVDSVALAAAMADGFAIDGRIGGDWWIWEKVERGFGNGLMEKSKRTRAGLSLYDTLRVKM